MLDLGAHPSVRVERSRHLQDNPDLRICQQHCSWQCLALRAAGRHQRLLLLLQEAPSSPQPSCHQSSWAQSKYFPGNNTHGSKKAKIQLRCTMAALPHSTSTTAESNPLWKRCLLECYKRDHKHNDCKIFTWNVSGIQGVAQSFSNLSSCAEQFWGREYKYIYIYLLNTICQKAVSKFFVFYETTVTSSGTVAVAEER